MYYDRGVEVMRYDDEYVNIVVVDVWWGGEYCIEVLEILRMIVRGDPAETSSKIWYFGGGFLQD